MAKDTITLLSLVDLTEANIIKTKLETQGIACFMNNKRHPVPSKAAAMGNIDIKVYMKDLDKALKLIAEDIKENDKGSF